MQSRTLRFTASAAAIASLTLLAACENHDRIAAPRATGDTSTAAVLGANGFNPSSLQDLGDAFLVEGDIRLSKRLVDQWRVSGPGDPLGLRPRFQWSINTLVGSSAVRSITVDLSGISSLSDWQTAVRQAMADWNGVTSSGVHFSEASPGDITFNASALGSGTAALASWPGDGASGGPGPTITIGSNFSATPNNASTKHYNMVHELGHTVGLRHTNWQNNPCIPGSEGTGSVGANQISGTPTTDAGSVMNGCTATTSWNGFSTYDRIAIATLYPGPRASISGPSSVKYGQLCTYTASVSNAVGSLAVMHWYGDDVGFGDGSLTVTVNTAWLDGFIDFYAIDANGKLANTHFDVTIDPNAPDCT